MKAPTVKEKSMPESVHRGTTVVVGDGGGSSAEASVEEQGIEALKRSLEHLCDELRQRDEQIEELRAACSSANRENTRLRRELKALHGGE